MIDHISIGSNQLARARGFYVAVLATVGLAVSDEADGLFVDFAAPGATDPEFSLETPSNGRPATAGNGVHIAFRAASREAVNAFHATALRHGGADAGAPGLRPHYGKDYYGAFVLDLEGAKLEAVCHLPDV